MKYNPAKIGGNRNGFAPSRGRELKSVVLPWVQHGLLFAPSRGRELKWGGTQRLASAPRRFAPSRGRELKCSPGPHNPATGPFAPSRGRELKYK